MRAVRISVFGPTGGCTTLIASEKDVREGCTLDDIAKPPPEVGNICFWLAEEFEVPNETTYETVLAIGTQLLQAKVEDERNMAIGYYFNLSRLMSVTDNGMLTSTTPAPLSAEQLRVMLRQLAKHPSYRGQTVIQIAKDWTVVKLEKGELMEPVALPSDAN